MDTERNAPSEILAALLFYTGIERMTSDSTPLHQALSLVRSDPLLRDFKLSAMSASSLFLELNLALANLQLTCFLKASDDLEEYYIDETAYCHIERFVLPLFSERERGSLARLAERLRPAVASFASEVRGGRVVFRNREAATARPTPDQTA